MGRYGQTVARADVPKLRGRRFESSLIVKNFALAWSKTRFNKSDAGTENVAVEKQFDATF